MVSGAGYEGARYREATSATVLGGLVGAVAVGIGVTISWVLAPAVAWVIGVAAYVTWVWVRVMRLGPADTASHARRDDPTRSLTRALLVTATVASFAAVAQLMTNSRADDPAEASVFAGAALLTVAASWVLVHVLFTLHYADVFYRDGETGVDFNQSVPPQYRDFAYLAFTLGMTYQVSDTSLTSSAMRQLALRHALLSFVFGVGILAATINLVSSLAR
jgi:uncharacterized membrane protein